MKNIITILLCVLYSTILWGCGNSNVELSKDNIVDLAEMPISKDIEETEIWTFVSNEKITNELVGEDASESVIPCGSFEDNIFILFISEKREKRFDISVFTV